MGVDSEKRMAVIFGGLGAQEIGAFAGVKESHCRVGSLNPCRDQAFKKFAPDTKGQNGKFISPAKRTNEKQFFSGHQQLGIILMYLGQC